MNVSARVALFPVVVFPVMVGNMLKLAICYGHSSARVRVAPVTLRVLDNVRMAVFASAKSA